MQKTIRVIHVSETKNPQEQKVKFALEAMKRWQGKLEDALAHDNSEETYAHLLRQYYRSLSLTIYEQ